ncbi:flagellar hook-length control protein FliK [Helicobacter pylori]|nr:flagellar hook-length control protein FliK [Helicobacter pylori]
MPSPVNPIHTNANALNSGAKNEVKDTKNAPKSASKDFSKILNQKISKDKTVPKESPNPNALKATPKDAKEDAKTLEKTPTLPHQHAQNPAKDQQAPTLKDWLNRPKTHPTAPHEAQHETHEANETNPKTPNETLSKNEKKPNEALSNAHQINLPNKNPITPNHANKTPTTPTHSAKEPKTLKDIQTLSQKHDLNASNIQATAPLEKKETPLSASDQLALKTTQTPTSHTLAKNDAKNTANLSSVLQSLEKKESQNKEHANPPNNEKKTPPLKEALEMNAIKRDKTLSKKKPEKTPIHAKTQTTAPSATPENAPKLALKTPPLMPLIGANPPNDNIPTPLEKEEKTKEVSDNKEKAKESSNSAQSAQNTQASDKTSDNKSIAPKETIKHFTQQLKQEIQEYKPPMSKISMDLFPKELGKVEVIIQKVGKNLKVSVISHNNSLQTFLDNQQDLKNSLNALGFEGVDLSFSQDSSKEQSKEQLRELFKEQESTPLKESVLKSYQENTDHEHKETSMQITLYA